MGLGMNKDKLAQNTEQAKAWWRNRNKPQQQPTPQQPNVQVNVYEDDQINIQE